MPDIKFSQFPDGVIEGGASVVGLDSSGNNVKFPADDFGLQPGDNISLLTNDVPYLDQAAADLLYATIAQGGLADSAVQPGDNVSVLANDANYKSYDSSDTLPDPAGYDEGFLYMVTD